MYSGRVLAQMLSQCGDEIRSRDRPERGAICVGRQSAEARARLGALSIAAISVGATTASAAVRGLKTASKYPGPAADHSMATS
jgi:hypothetical protein